MQIHRLPVLSETDPFRGGGDFAADRGYCGGGEESDGLLRIVRISENFGLIDILKKLYYKLILPTPRR